MGNAYGIYINFQGDNYALDFLEDQKHTGKYPLVLKKIDMSKETPRLFHFAKDLPYTLLSVDSMGTPLQMSIEKCSWVGLHCALMASNLTPGMVAGLSTPQFNGVYHDFQSPMAATLGTITGNVNFLIHDDQPRVVVTANTTVWTFLTIASIGAFQGKPVNPNPPVPPPTPPHPPVPPYNPPPKPPGPPVEPKKFPPYWYAVIGGGVLLIIIILILLLK